MTEDEVKRLREIEAQARDASWTVQHCFGPTPPPAAEVNAALGVLSAAETRALLALPRLLAEREKLLEAVGVCADFALQTDFRLRDIVKEALRFAEEASGEQK